MSRVDFLRDVGQRGVWALVRLSITFPWTTLLMAVALAVLSIWYTSGHLKFQTSRNALVSQNARYIQRFEEIDKDFYDQDAFIVVLEPPHLERGKQFVHALVARLRTDTQHFRRVIDKIDTSSLEGKKLLLLSPADLRTLQQRLQDAQTVAHGPGGSARSAAVVSISESRDEQGTCVVSDRVVARLPEARRHRRQRRERPWT